MPSSVLPHPQTAFIAMGSNLANKKRLLLYSITLIKELGTITAVSAFFKNRAITTTKQPPFLNAVICLQTSLPPFDLLNKLQIIERRCGRPLWRGHHKARRLDLDIIYYDRLVLTSRRLRLPHPQRLKRDFVLLPMASIAYSWIDPVSGRSIGTEKRRLGIRAGNFRAYKSYSAFTHPSLLH